VNHELKLAFDLNSVPTCVVQGSVYARTLNQHTFSKLYCLKWSPSR